MASTEMIVGVADSKFVALRPDSDVREALMANLGPGESLQPTDLPRVPTPSGGGKVWSWIDAGNNEQSAKSLDGLMVAVVPRGTLWGSEQPQAGAKPVLVTYDLDTAFRANDDIGDLDADVLESCRTGDRTYDWKRLPYNKFPSDGGIGSSGRGKRCKESRLVAILRAEDAWPLLVNVSVGSFPTVLPFIKRLPVAHFRCIVSLTLEKVENAGGQPFSRIVPKLLGTISKDEGEIVRRLYTEPLSRIAHQIDAPQDVA